MINKLSIRFFVILLIATIPTISFGGDCSSTIATVESCNKITRNGITWTLAANETVGQYVLGDYFVVDDGNVSISSISPTPSGGRNGSQKNPSNSDQPFDSRANNYNAALLFTGGAVTGGDSIVSTISVTTSSINWDNKTAGTPELLSMEILSIVPSAPSTSPRTFRPAAQDRLPYTTYTTADIDNTFLPGLSTAGMSTFRSSFSTMAEFLERGSSRPWLLWGNDWESRYIHPLLNMYDYHEDIGHFLSTLMLAVMSDQKTDAMLYGFLQIVIDYMEAGNRDSAVWSMPYAVGGLLLGNSAIYNYWIDDPSERNNREHEKLYYVDDVSATPTSSIVPTGETWIEWTNATGDYVAFRKQVGEEHEHLHPSEWTCYAPHCKAEVYRTQHDIYPLVGMTLATMIADSLTVSDVNAMIAHDPTKDYVHRWMEEGFQTNEYKSTGRTYREEMEYYTTFDIYNYYYGSGGNGFVNDMWDEYRDIESATCATSASQCTTYSECEIDPGSWNWCTDVCQESPCNSPPPVIDTPIPAGSLVYTTTAVTLGITSTDDAADTVTCKYDTSNVAYSSMGNTFTNTGGSASCTAGVCDHTEPNYSVTAGSSYTIYVACNDGGGDSNTEAISFSVNSAAVECNATHFWLCLTQETCEGVAGDPFFWWDGACRTVDEPTDWSGSNTLLNSGFTDWAVSSYPDYWVRPTSCSGYAAEGTDNLILYTDGVAYSAVRQDFGTEGDGVTYRYAINVWGDDSYLWTEAEDRIDTLTPGTYTGLIHTTVDNARFYISVDGTEKTAYFDDVVIRQVSVPSGKQRGIGFKGVNIE